MSLISPNYYYSDLRIANWVHYTMGSVGPHRLAKRN